MRRRNIVISSIIFVLCILASNKLVFPSRCYGMKDGLWILLTSTILLIFVIILFIYDIYKKLISQQRINYLPYLILLLTVSIVILIRYSKSEKFKSQRILTAYNSDQELILRANNSYELTHKLPEIGCTERGQYKISNDTIYLTEELEINQTLYIDEKYLIDTINQQLIPIFDDSISTKKEFYLNIKKI
jgi:hypothetical protein